MTDLIDGAVNRKVALVTGASGGIGEAIAQRLVHVGWRVAIHFQSNRDKALALAERLNRGGDDVAATFQADVSQESEVEALFHAVIARFGRLDGLVNNAGIITPVGPISDVTQARLERLMSVNVVGPFLCAKWALKCFEGAGVVVNVSSAAARLGSAHQFIDYAASKGAMDTFTIGLAQEVAAAGVRVNAVRPGLIDTELHAKACDADRVTRLKSAVPMQRVGEAAEVASTVVWLMSDEASYVTGAILDVSGGR